MQGATGGLIGTNDTRPYRVFHDVSGVPDGKLVAYRAVVRDNAGHTRVSARERVIVPKPTLILGRRPRAPTYSGRLRSKRP